MSLSSGKLNDIAALYESIAASEQEQLDEVITSGAPTAATSARSSYMKSAGQQAVKGYQQSKADDKAVQARQDSYRASRNTSPGATTKSQLIGGASAATPAKTAPAAAKYKSSSDGKMYKNYNDALAARNSRMKAGSTAPAAGTPPAAAAKPAPTAAAKPAGTPAKTAPAAAGDGMKAWAAAHPDLAAKVKSGQSGYNDIQQQRTSAALKAPAAPASSTLGKTVAAASKPQTAFNPSVTPSAATAAAPSTSPAASGSVVPGTNKLAAMKQQPEVKPQAIAASYEYEDAYDVVLEYLLDTGHAESVAEAQYIMTELDQESINEIAEAYKKFPTEKVMNKAGKLMGSSAGKTDPASKKKENRGIKMMDKMMQHTPD
jgi:hypothetical protein